MSTAKKINPDFDYDQEETRLLNKAIQVMGESLTRESNLFSTSLSYLEKEYLVKVDGSGKIKKSKRKTKSVATIEGLKKGTVLHAKK